VSDAVHERNDEPETGVEGADIAPEALDRIVVALRHHPNSAREVDDDDRK
jgi:hypothetical protein